MTTLILQLTAALLASTITFFLGYILLRHEDDLVSVIGAVTAMVGIAVLFYEIDGDRMLAIEYLQNIAYAVGCGTLLMFMVLALIRRRRVKAGKTARAKVPRKEPPPRPRVQYYEKWDHPPWDPPRDPGHPKI